MTILKASDIIPTKSPLALVGVFLDILRSRFAENKGLDWVWYPYDEGRQASTVQIEAGNNSDVEENAKRPAIFVLRGPIQYSQAGIGDRVIRDSPTGTDIFYALAQTSFTIACEAEKSAEAELLADIVLSTLMMGSDEIERTFQFRKLGPFALSASGKSRQDTDIAQVNVQMGLNYDVRWATHAIRPLLKEVIVKARESTYTNSETYFIELYQQSLADSPNSSN